MENKDIHNGLDNKELRDYLSKAKRKENITGHLSNVEYLENHIEDLKVELEHAKTVRALMQIINSNGWKEFDVSGIVPYVSDTYFPFIGTEEEYDKLVKKAKVEGLEVKDK